MTQYIACKFKAVWDAINSLIVTPTGINYNNSDIPESLVINASSGANGSYLIGNTWAINPSIAAGYTATGGWEITKDGIAFYGPSGGPLIGFYKSTFLTNNIVTDATTARSLISSDADQYINFTNGAGATVTVLPNSSVPIGIGTEIVIRRSGGPITLVQGSGVTITDYTLATSVAINSNFALKKVGTNIWHFV